MRILVVDDSRAVRTCMRQKLEENDYEVLEAADGQEAVRLTEKHQPDLITMDIDMPGMDGFAATAAIRALDGGQQIPIVFVTSKDSLADREKGFHLGASEFISKSSVAPWQEIAYTVNRMLRSKTLPGHFTALVAEDNAVTRSLVCNILTNEGFRVLEANNGKQALEHALEYRSEIDLVITDFMMPEMDGGELCVQLRTKLGLRRTPIIFLSGVTERGMILNMFHAGATDYVMKPFAKEELLARIGVHMEQWELVKELNRTVIQLEHLNKLRDEFTAMASHDLKSPLNSIMGFTQVMLQDSTLTANHQQMLTNIRDSSQLILEIANNIVALRQLETQQQNRTSSPLPLQPLVNIAIASLQQTAATKGVLLDVDHSCCPYDTVINGSRHDFLRILNNLLTNAVKFTPAGGKVTLSQTTVQKHGTVTVSVTDTGIGIPTDMLPTIFDKFTKTSRAGTDGERGTGLGLAISRRLARQYGGDIEVTSDEGKGSCFRLFLPLSPAPQ